MSETPEEYKDRRANMLRKELSNLQEFSSADAIEKLICKGGFGLEDLCDPIQEVAGAIRCVASSIDRQTKEIKKLQRTPPSFSAEIREMKEKYSESIGYAIDRLTFVLSREMESDRSVMASGRDSLDELLERLINPSDFRDSDQ